MTEQRKTRRRSSLFGNADEQLGENYTETPWLPPSLLRAREYRRKKVLIEDNDSLYRISIISDLKLSVGIRSYFVFMSYFTVYFFISSILAIPIVFFSYFGHKIDIQDRDSFILYRFTLGNIGKLIYLSVILLT